MRAYAKRVAVPATAVAILAVAWVPTLVADRYADAPGGAQVGLVRIDRGWQFVYQAVRLSRGARLGSEGAAKSEARRRWAGAPAVAASVRLTYLDGPFTVPVPPGGVAPHPRERVARPESPLGWAVRGSVRGGPSQMIGLLDYRSGHVAWDIRRLLPAGRRSSLRVG